MQDLGEKICQATLFVRDTYSQVQGLLLACDACFEKRGLVPAWGREVELDARRNIEAPQAWVQAAIGRAYVPLKQFNGKVTHIFFVEVHLAPTVATHALAVLAMALPSPLATPGELGTAYGEGHWVETWLAGKYPAQTEMRGVRSEHPQLLPLADQLFVKAWPLTQLTDEAAVETILATQIAVWAPDLPK